ncbi:hypothetical protein F4678DRAFT_451158 [Xylaria arbuscula]|nr:hypothetical protein F4678DRAFT_451158 [Xylaria arbuscula]
MTSQPDSPATTTAYQCDPIDYPDVVATQGAYLVPCPRTPVFPKAYLDEFATLLEKELNAVLIEKDKRTRMYHGDADDWAMGHTPIEIKENHRARLKAWVELWDMTSDDESDNDDGKHKGSNGVDGVDGTVGRGNTVAAPGQRRRPRRPQGPHQAELLPTPPMSAKSHLSIPQRRKRRRESEEDDEGKERPAKKHVSSAKQVSAAAGYGAQHPTAEEPEAAADYRRGRRRGGGERAAEQGAENHHLSQQHVGAKTTTAVNTTTWEMLSRLLQL